MRPEAIFAEIVHLPQGRTGNIIARPAVRRHAMSYLARCDVEPDARIPLQDLMVQVDGDGRFRLRFASRDREIVPRLTQRAQRPNRRAPALSIPVDAAGAVLDGWSWGPLGIPVPAAGPSRQGRPRRGALEHRAVEARADRRRNVACRPLRGGAKGSRGFGLPRWLVLVEGDRLLPIDFDNIVLIDLLADTSARSGRRRRGSPHSKSSPPPPSYRPRTVRRGATSTRS